ncbi:MAG: hypothetical protein ABEH47_09325 [Haloferacaceae archaeon]
MAERASFVCGECGGRVSPTSYRAACPECGGRLRRDPGVDAGATGSPIDRS